MEARTRAVAYGAAALLVVAGALSALFVGDVIGGILAIALITLGLGGALLLLFFEVGLSEERELAREKRRRRATERPAARPRLPRWPRRPS